MTAERPTVLHPATIDPDGPPDGYSLPKAAADLMKHAAAHGWLSRANWVAGPGIDEPFVVVDVGRKLLVAEDAPVCPGDQYAPVRIDSWSYRVTWHSRDARPGQLKLFRKPLASTPWRPAHHDGPSVKGIRDMISRFPRPELCCNPVDGRCGGGNISSRCVKAGGCCYSKNAVCPKHH